MTNRDQPPPPPPSTSTPGDSATSNSSPRDLPPLHLEQLARDELSPGRRAAALARLGPDADARLAALAASDREILAAHPPAIVAASIQRRLDARAPRRLRLVLYAAPALACAALAFLVLRTGPGDDPLPQPLPSPPLESPDGVRIKGLEPRLVVHRQAGDATVELTHPARARAQDVLQVSYIAAGATHGVILSLDGNGTVTLHHPAGIADSTALRQDGAVRLPQSYELDDAPKFERFLFITADTPLPVDRLLAAARDLATTSDPAGAPLVLPTGARQTSFLVEKPAP